MTGKHLSAENIQRQTLAIGTLGKGHFAPARAFVWSDEAASGSQMAHAPSTLSPHNLATLSSTARRPHCGSVHSSHHLILGNWGEKEYAVISMLCMSTPMLSMENLPTINPGYFCTTHPTSSVPLSSPDNAPHYPFKLRPVMHALFFCCPLMEMGPVMAKTTRATQSTLVLGINKSPTVCVRAEA